MSQTVARCPPKKSGSILGGGVGLALQLAGPVFDRHLLRVEGLPRAGTRTQKPQIGPSYRI